MLSLDLLDKVAKRLDFHSTAIILLDFFDKDQTSLNITRLHSTHSTRWPNGSIFSSIFCRVKNRVVWPGPNIDALLTNANKELRNISEWMRVNKLSANPDKTEYMIIGHPRRTNKVEISQPLHLNDSEIKRVTKTKSLGVMVDEGLNWDDQFNKVKGKMNGGLKSLKKLKNLIPQSQLDHVYRAVIESHLRYANVI